ncbi:MAG TPA: hypothetical protein PLD20_34615 [Blastocatellia bacterium]|nr:hypothetical protein [Blastocatellia bacterium]HMX27180.1 hypothetical protein [Blastocatellia bacterium]HMY74374.1 hypothetical protein [Blastocatellia bacterium]HMZ23109.1 hypothetical protein [Blastocatellia bacterium]HNG34018.1 hypothetical protein [Blastocatellia bacterium]
MTVQLQVASDTARLLQANAVARKISLEDYLRGLAEADSVVSSPSTFSLEEFERDMDALADGPEDLPILPDDFSRADIYADHD